jgi:hypothetical protein
VGMKLPFSENSQEFPENILNQRKYKNAIKSEM